MSFLLFKTANLFYKNILKPFALDVGGYTSNDVVLSVKEQKALEKFLIDYTKLYMIVFAVNFSAQIVQNEMHHISFVVSKIGLYQFCLKSTKIKKNSLVKKGFNLNGTLQFRIGSLNKQFRQKSFVRVVFPILHYPILLSFLVIKTPWYD